MPVLLRSRLPLLLLAVLSQHLVAQDQHLIDSLYRAFHQEKDPIRRVDLLYEIANEQDDSGDPSTGFRYADSLELLSKAAHYEKGLARALDIRGIAYSSEGKYTTALPYFHQQLAIFVKLKDLAGQARALNHIGSAWQEISVNDSAVTYFLRSLDLKEQLGNQSDVAATLSNIANIYSDEKAYDKAIELHQRALRIRREIGEEKRIMFTFNNLAVACGLKGDFARSTAYADTGITVALKFNNKLVAGVICGGMGHVLNEQKRYAESVKWCQRSISYLTEAKREANLVFPLCNLATAYNGLGEYAKALEINQKGWEIMQRLHLQQPLDPYHENFANAYAGLGDYKSAFEWHKVYSQRIDSVTNVDNTSKVANIEAKYGLEKKERQLSEQRAENFRQRVGLVSLALALLALVVLGYLFWNRYRLRQKAALDAAVIREQQLGLNAVIEAQEAERKRIAKDLHDGIAQELVALRLGFNALQHQLGPNPYSATLETLTQQLDTSCTEVRNIAHLMLPPTLEQQGLVPSLELLLRNSLPPAGIQCEFEHFGLPEQLEEKVSLGLYRIAQELVNNVVKHAQAHRVQLQLYSAGANLVMTVEDDGRGYDFEEARRQGSMGLLNILSRVSTLGGVFFSENRHPNGVVSTVRVPVEGRV